MMNKKYTFDDCIKYCGFEQLPFGLEQYFNRYDESAQLEIIDQDFLQEILAKYKVPDHKRNQMEAAIKEIEEDDILSYFTKFLIWDMCHARKRYEDNDYQALIPKCKLEFANYYSFLILLACVKPSMQMLQNRWVPIEYYEKIPYTPMEKQFEKWIVQDDVSVSDFPWDLNFYTCSIFWLGRFQYIPCKFENDMTVYRNRNDNKVVALQHGDMEFRRDGQVNGTNGVYDETGKFISRWEEDEFIIRANPVNPMGYVERTPITLQKADWEVALKKGDILLAFHIPAGPGYLVESVGVSMELALEFYKSYYSELNIKGFWSESWLYDSRLSLIMNDENSNIIKVQRQFYLYPTKDSDGMLLERVFGDKHIDLSNVTCKTSLQEKVVSYMKTGARFNALSMFVLKEEVPNIGNNPYITKEDIEHFAAIVDSHLK